MQIKRNFTLAIFKLIKVTIFCIAAMFLLSCVAFTIRSLVLFLDGIIIGKIMFPELGLVILSAVGAFCSFELTADALKWVNDY